MLNILFLGGAKRVSIARMFVAAGEAAGHETHIFSYELSKRVPIACVATVFEGLRWNDPEILPDLHRLVQENDIKIIIPFVDVMVSVAARYAETYGDVFVPCSAHQVCDAMFDKLISAELFERAHIPAPVRYEKGRPEFPLIAKPRTGSASKGIRIIENVTDFRSVITPPERYLIQEYIKNREEFTVDCYVSRGGDICCISPRKRLEVVGGEVMRTVTVDYPEIVDLTRRLIVNTGLRGAVTVQFLKDCDDGRLLIMEVNPRPGGGAVCSVHAGADIPAMIVAESLGFNPRPAKARAGVEITRYFQEVVFDNVES